MSDKPGTANPKEEETGLKERTEEGRWADSIFTIFVFQIPRLAFQKSKACPVDKTLMTPSPMTKLCWLLSLDCEDFDWRGWNYSGPGDHSSGNLASTTVVASKQEPPSILTANPNPILGHQCLKESKQEERLSLSRQKLSVQWLFSLGQIILSSPVATFLFFISYSFVFLFSCVKF